MGTIDISYLSLLTGLLLLIIPVFYLWKFKADNEYKEWIAGISTDFRKSQIRASMKINDEMLRFYWKLGKGISSMSEQFGYGMGFYKTVSDDLKSILPDVKSFSPTNLKYMRYFYEMYPDAVICPQVEDELITDANMSTIEEIEAELNE